MVNWWPFSEDQSKQQSSSTASEFDSYVPPPPSGAVLPPPELPKFLKNVPPLSSVPEFKGFSPPPKDTLNVKKTPSKSSSLFSFLSHDSIQKDFDLQKSLRNETIEGYETLEAFQQGSNKNGPKWVDQYLTNPRARNCYESVKMGAKMGASVGAIFGGLTGIYAGILHRSPLLIPISIVGGGLSFGFFLGCGMLVRCEPCKSD